MKLPQWICGSSCPQQPFLTQTVTICSYLMVSVAMFQEEYAVLPGAKILFCQSLSHPMSIFYSTIYHYFSDVPLSVMPHPAMDNDDAPTKLAACHPSMNSPIYVMTNVFADSVVGCGFLEWNSPIGVPLNAWWTIVLMMVFCVGCKRAHSCDGHSAHLNIHGQPPCRLPINKGELEITEVSDPKGKGKACKLWWSVWHFLCFLTWLLQCPFDSLPFLT